MEHKNARPLIRQVFELYLGSYYCHVWKRYRHKVKTLSPQGKIVIATREKAVDDPVDIEGAFTNKEHGEAAVSFYPRRVPLRGFLVFILMNKATTNQDFFGFYFNE